MNLGKLSGVGWTIFVGCMFVGAGIGMIFENPDAGAVIGMGIGFVIAAIFMALDAKSRNSGWVQSYEREMTLAREAMKIVGPLAIVALGVAFIVMGLDMAEIVKLPIKEYAPWIAIGIGILFVIAGLALLFSRRKSFVWE